MDGGWFERVCVSMRGLWRMIFRRQKAECRYERMICVWVMYTKNGGLWDEVVV